jgi:hypothetical protein
MINEKKGNKTRAQMKNRSCELFEKLLSIIFLEGLKKYTQNVTIIDGH